MPRAELTQEPLLGALDRGWLGVDMRLDPDKLPQGFASEAINMRFNRGVAETRGGHVSLPWCYKLTGGLPQPWGTVQGVGVFSDPTTGGEYLFIAADSKIYYTSENNVPVEMTLPAMTTFPTSVTFTQAFDVMLLHRGESALYSTLVSTGVGSGTFTAVTQSVSGSGTETIPNAARSTFALNRLFVPHGDQVAVSDLNDYTRYVSVLQDFRINQGSADTLVAVEKFNDLSFVAFKERSIHVITNVYGDLSSVRQDLLTDQFGLAAARSVAQCGKDLVFLSALGVMTLTQTDSNNLQGVVLPLSDQIQPLIDRINWQYASNACAAYADNKYYLAVPLDSAESTRHELVASGGVYTGGTFSLAGLVAGQTYRYTVGGTADVSVTNGTQTLTRSGDFTAQGTTVTLNGTAAAAVTASVKQIFSGCNNAVLVYDFLNRAWSGYDQAEGLEVAELFVFTYQQRRRLFFATPDGYIKLYEQDYEDVLSIPYTDVAVAALPSVGNTIRVNSGTTVTAAAAALNTLPSTWGADTLPNAITNLFTGSNNVAGYYVGGTGGYWTAPDTQVVKTSTGVRFYATNGVIPAVVTAGSWATVTEVNVQQITSSITTRAYTSESLDFSDYQWLVLDLATWNPTYTVSILSEGALEETTVISGRTRDRTAYYAPFNHAAFDVTNANGDATDKYRRDYSIVLGPAGAATYTLGSAGVRLDLHQEARDVFHIRVRGRAARVKIVNTQGRIRLLNLKLASELRATRAGAIAA